MAHLKRDYIRVDINLKQDLLKSVPSFFTKINQKGLIFFKFMIIRHRFFQMYLQLTKFKTGYVSITIQYYGTL